MNRLFDDFWLSRFGETDPWAGAYLAPVNIHEEDNRMVVSAELPGVKESDIEVTVRKDTVRIAGEKKQEAETKEENFYRVESSYGRFDRLIDLPAEVDEDKAEAEFKNGVLTVRMPKTEDSTARAKKIPIKAG
jgi:HSP20 family protein